MVHFPFPRNTLPLRFLARHRLLSVTRRLSSRSTLLPDFPLGPRCSPSSSLEASSGSPFPSRFPGPEPSGDTAYLSAIAP